MPYSGGNNVGFSSHARNGFWMCRRSSLPWWRSVCQFCVWWAAWKYWCRLVWWGKGSRCMSDRWTWRKESWRVGRCIEVALVCANLDVLSSFPLSDNRYESIHGIPSIDLMEVLASRNVRLHCMQLTCGAPPHRRLQISSLVDDVAWCVANHRVLVGLLAGCQGLGLAWCRLPAATVHRHTVSKSAPVGPPEDHPAVTAIGAKLCIVLLFHDMLSSKSFIAFRHTQQYCNDMAYKLAIVPDHDWIQFYAPIICAAFSSGGVRCHLHYFCCHGTVTFDRHMQYYFTLLVCFKLCSCTTLVYNFLLNYRAALVTDTWKSFVIIIMLLSMYIVFCLLYTWCTRGTQSTILYIVIVLYIPNKNSNSNVLPQ